MNSRLTDALTKLARSIGLVDTSAPPQDAISAERTPEDVKRALAAARRIRAQAKKMKLGVTDEEILRWVKEGRR